MALPIKTLPFYLTKQEFVMVNSRISSPLGWFGMPLYGVVMGVILTFLLGPSTGIAAGAVVVIFGLFMPFIRRNTVQQLANHRYSQWAFTDVRTMEFFPDYFVVELSSGFMSRVPWALVSAANLVGQVVVLVIGGGQNIILPLRTFASAEDRKTLSELLAEKGIVKAGKIRKAIEAGAVTP
ncbi:MAG TPA: hypothetical protein VG944_04320 [Fimbriimonas sp.]|nr:hypothetical protein [Fimbriimonas sp.]